MALIQNEDVIGHLLDNALAKKQVTVENIVYEAEELFVLYIKKLLLLASRLGNPGLPDCLVITVEALSRELTELFGKVAEDLGLGRSQLILQDRKDTVTVGEQIQAFLYRAVYTRALNVLKHRDIKNSYEAVVTEINQ